MYVELVKSYYIGYGTQASILHISLVEPSLSSLELAHLVRDKDGRQRAVKQPLKEYWHEGVTARINNSRDVHKPPLPSGEVTSAALKVQ